MPNLHRGEIEAILDDKTYTLCLTLGALAELENCLGADDLIALTERFENGRMKSSDITHIICAGLKGGGYEVDIDEVSRMKVHDGAVGYINIAVRLLKATFHGE